MPSQKSRINHGISFEPKLLPVAKEKAAKNRQSFSAYINSLLAADLSCELSATCPHAAEASERNEPKAA